MTDPRASSYSFLRFPFRTIRVTLGSNYLEIKEGRCHLRVAYDQIIQEVAYGYLRIQGLYLQVQSGEKVGHLLLYSNYPSGQRKLASIHAGLEESLDSYHSFREDSYFDAWSYTLRSMLHSWKRIASHEKRA